jgi:flagellar basal-body rod modification protein FlgD
MPVSPITSGSKTGQEAVESVASRIPQKTLGQQDFLKLLATQFQVQDPLKPMEDTAFIAQMAQFSALDQSSALARDMTLMRAEQTRVAANSYLGHRVTVEDVSGETRSGEVSAVDASGSEPKIVVDGKAYSLSAVLRVEPGLVSAPAPQPVTSGGAQS